MDDESARPGGFVMARSGFVIPALGRSKLPFAFPPSHALGLPHPQLLKTQLHEKE